ncbi:heparin lyase I family protein [Planktotalea sp.]|uniref:heparin lyase I family protein n=1 Tax=Planktotalea sp. TaxID=2029877 RepID=UPI003296C48F
MTLRSFLINSLASFALLLTASTAGANPTYTDTDWNATLKAGCGLPEPKGGKDSIAWVQKGQDRKLLFTLQKGQVGTCSTDNQARHRAAFWERAELSQHGGISLGKVNTIEFEATFLDGFRGERETFFQIHNWSRTCNASPPLMMKMHKGKLQVLTLQGVRVQNGILEKQGKHRSVYRKTTKIKKLIGKPSKFRVVFDARGVDRGTLDVYLNNKQLVKDARIDYASCAKPYAKIGIYRPGGVSRTSQIVFDDVLLTNK